MSYIVHFIPIVVFILLFVGIGLWTKLFPRAPNFIQKNSVSKLHYRILGSI